HSERPAPHEHTPPSPDDGGVDAPSQRRHQERDGSAGPDEVKGAGGTRLLAAQRHEPISGKRRGADRLRDPADVLPCVLLEIELEHRCPIRTDTERIDLAVAIGRLNSGVPTWDVRDPPPRVGRRVVSSSADRLTFGVAPAEDD